MTICNPGELKRSLPTGKRILGIDPGSKTIGLALSDTLLMIASPYRHLERKSWDKDIAALRDIIVREDVGGVLIGLPKQMDGSEGEAARAARKLADKLLAAIEIPIAFWDERLSTSAVQRMMTDEMDLTRKKRKAAVDKVAAAYILQGALDSMGVT